MIFKGTGINVTTIGQIDTKTQYSMKRKEFRQPHYLAESSLGGSKSDFIQNSSIQKPLQGSVHSHISFKGFDLNSVAKFLNPVIKPVPRKLTSKVFESLKNISDAQYKYYSDIRKEYVDFIKVHSTPPKDELEKIKREAAAIYRRRHGISLDVAASISEDNLYYLPKKTLLVNFAYQVVSPIRAVYKSLQKIILPKNSEKARRIAIQEKITRDFASLEGLLKSHEIWENGYRKISGNPKWTENSNFLIPDKVLYSKLQRRRNKVVDPNKGKYSSTSLMLGNRLISGIIYSYFLGTDAYNTTMRYSDNKHEAAAQRNSRIVQEFSRIGLNMYIQNLLFGTFEAAVNRSLPTAMFVSGSTVAFSEILGRKLVGKPIMPSDKDTLDRLEKEMSEKKGILPSIGRLLTNVKKSPAVSADKSTDSVSYSKSNPNEKVFHSFASKDKVLQAETGTIVQDKAKPSFKGYYSVEYLFDKKKLSQIVKIVEKADEKTAKSLKEAVMKSVEKSKYFEKMNLERPKSFEELIESSLYKDAPVGTKKTVWGLWTKSFLVPVTFVKNIFVKSKNGVQKIYNSVVGTKNNSLSKECQNHKQNDPAFQHFLQERLSLPAWGKGSSLTLEEKELRIYREFCELVGKDKEDIEGAKNILLWLEQQLKREHIEIREDGTFDEKDIKRVAEILKESVLNADSAKHVEYDGNTLAQTNINLARAITTLFLVTDAYNLTMQYSNDNRKDANKSAKNRAAQEISRISVSAYVLAFVHNLLSKLCNSSLAGAFTLTALTSSINDSISRQVVGVPLTAKTQKQLEEIDKKNSKSKSPIKKALAYSIGKKSAMPSVKSYQSVNYDSFSDDFFIKPEIS